MEVIVKLSWSQTESNTWYASLVTSSLEGLHRHELIPGEEVNWEIVNERRCIGRFKGIGELEPCPEFAEIRAGSQCVSCRRDDIYADYVTGQSGAKVDDDVSFSVYLAQCGETVKVGVTRSEKLERRWIEQGADYGTELFGGLTSEDALEKEDKISEQHDIPQRIRKERKICTAENKIKDVLAQIEIEAEVIDLSEKRVYNSLPCADLVRSGRLVGELSAVKGQIISAGRRCVAVTSGKVVQEPVQRGLGDF